MRPRRVTRDREGPHTGVPQILAPVPQEHELVRSGGRPVPHIKTQ
jgi:hypothetical protein